MTIKEAKQVIDKILSDPRRAKVFSAQMLMAARRGINPVVQMDGKQIRLVRIGAGGKTSH